MTASQRRPEAEQDRRLRRMKAVPLALLALMALVFALTFRLPEAVWVGYLQAFTEAAMVGALADWFAVVALFRHPLGLPIPHTAIIPRRKDELADSLADFVHRHFLVRRVIERRMGQGQPAMVLADWLSAHAREVAQAVRRSLTWALGAMEMPVYRDFLRRNVFSAMSDLELAPILGRFLSMMSQNRHHQALFTEALRLGITFLEDNRETIRTQINQGSPWWVPGFVDDKIYDQMVERIQTQLLAMVLDPDHTLRRSFDEAFQRLAEDLQRSPGYARMLEGLKQDLLDNPTLTGYLDEAIERSAGAMADSLENDPEPFESTVVEIIERSAADVRDQPELRKQFNLWLTQAIVYVVEHYGAQMTALISDTVRTWDAQDASRRIEREVGRDLQFIRINGTLVGGLVGLIIHALVLGLH